MSKLISQERAEWMAEQLGIEAERVKTEAYQDNTFRLQMEKVTVLVNHLHLYLEVENRVAPLFCLGTESKALVPIDHILEAHEIFQEACARFPDPSATYEVDETGKATEVRL